MSKPNSQPSPQRYHEDEIDLLALGLEIWDKKFFIVAVTAVFAFGGIAYALLATPIYRANALVQIEDKKATLPGLSDMTEMFGGESAANTEIELIKSRRIVGEAVDKKRLNIVTTPKYFPLFGKTLARRFSGADGEVNSPLFGFTSFATGGERLAVHRLDVPDNQYGKTLTLVTNDDGSFTLRNSEDEPVLTGPVGQELANGGYGIYISELTANPGTHFYLKKLRKLTSIIEYQNRLGIGERGKDSGILSLSLEDEDPQKATHILDLITSAYLRQNVERQSAEAAQSVDYLRRRLPQIKKDLERAEENFNDYQVRAGSVNISAETEVLLEQVVEIEAGIAELEMQRAELDRKYTTDHPVYQSWREQLAEQKARKEEFSTRIKSLPETQQELLGLKRDLEVGTEIYTQMLGNIQELDIVRAGTVGNVRIVDEAAVNLEEPVKPKKALIVVIATMLGGFFGIALTLVRAALNKGVENPEDIEAMGLPVYASIPLSEEQRKQDRFGKRMSRNTLRDSHPTTLLAQSNPTDISIESLRSLRTSLHFAMLEAKNNIMMISGPSPSVGKSFVSGNLAAVIAQSGKSVLLIDMDMRRGYMHRMFGTRAENGLSELLAEQTTLEEAISATKVPDLFLLPRGSAPPNPSELLMSKGLTDLLDAVSDKYDFVIVDTPPILAVTDAAIVGRHCGVTMIVTRFGLNPAKEIALTQQRFEQNGIPLKGAIFNAVERRASGYGYGYGYNYGYEYKTEKS